MELAGSAPCKGGWSKVAWLRAAGFEPELFASAEALLESDAAVGAACMVLDIHLPGLSGFQLRDLLSNAGTRPPVIFITAHDEPAVREQAEKAGAVAYLNKPFASRTLLEKIGQALHPSRPDKASEKVS